MSGALLRGNRVYEQRTGWLTNALWRRLPPDFEAADRAAGIETPAERRSNDLSLLERGLTGQRDYVVLRTGAAADADGADHLAAGHQDVSTA